MMSIFKLYLLLKRIASYLLFWLEESLQMNWTDLSTANEDRKWIHSTMRCLELRDEADALNLAF